MFHRLIQIWIKILKQFPLTFICRNTRTQTNSSPNHSYLHLDPRSLLRGVLRDRTARRPRHLHDAAGERGTRGRRRTRRTGRRAQPIMIFALWGSRKEGNQQGGGQDGSSSSNDNASSHHDEKAEPAVRAAAGVGLAHDGRINSELSL